MAMDSMILIQMSQYRKTGTPLVDMECEKYQNPGRRCIQRNEADQESDLGPSGKQEAKRGRDHADEC